MTQIKSRSGIYPDHIMREAAAKGQTPERVMAKHELAIEVAVELDALVDKIDSFLEMRIAEEFKELRDDIARVTAINDNLMEENMRFRDQISKLSLLELRRATSYVNIGEVGGELVIPLSVKK